MRARGSGLKGRITAFFEENPHEWLTLADAVAKWDVTRKQVCDTVAHIKREGGAVRVEDGTVKTVWTRA